MTQEELEEYSFDLLYKSCKAVFSRRRDDNKPSYKGMACDWLSPLGMAVAHKDKEKFFAKWMEISKRYYESGEDPLLRPTLDRIINCLGYVEDNIQCLAWRDNFNKDNACECIMQVTKHGRVLDQIRFNSIMDAWSYFEMNYSNVSYEKLKKRRDECGWFEVGDYQVLIQSVNGSPKDNTKTYGLRIPVKAVGTDKATGERVELFGYWNGECEGIWFTKDGTQLTANN